MNPQVAWRPVAGSGRTVPLSSSLGDGKASPPFDRRAIEQWEVRRRRAAQSPSLSGTSTSALGLRRGHLVGDLFATLPSKEVRAPLILPSLVDALVQLDVPLPSSCPALRQ